MKIYRMATTIDDISEIDVGDTLIYNYPKAPYKGTCKVLKKNDNGTIDVMDNGTRFMPEIPITWDRYPMFKGKK